MKCLLTTMLLAVAAMFTLGVVSHAEAGGGGGGYGGYGAGWWGLNWLHSNPYYPSDRRIPYFAQHPPVYYSYPVPRTYGYSPWASPPTYTAPEVRVDPVIIPNPYVPSKPAKVQRDERSAARQHEPQPLVVVNPYVQQESSLASRR